MTCLCGAKAIPGVSLCVECLNALRLQVKRERAECLDLREQPPCAGCGHRRIFHFARKAQRAAEIPARCMVDTDNPERRACGCDEYRAQELAHAR